MKKIVIMNTNNIQVVLLMVVMLLTASVVGAVNYPTYKPSKMASSEVSYQAVTNYAAVGSLSPMLNADGTAVHPYADSQSSAQPAGITSGPRRVGDNDAYWSDPANAPIGTTPWLMMLLLLGGYAAALMRKRQQNKEHLSSY